MVNAGSILGTQVTPKLTVIGFSLWHFRVGQVILARRSGTETQSGRIGFLRRVRQDCIPHPSWPGGFPQAGRTGQVRSAWSGNRRSKQESEIACQSNWTLPHSLHCQCIEDSAGGGAPWYGIWSSSFFFTFSLGEALAGR
jgi:hypothetical protein